MTKDQEEKFEEFYSNVGRAMGLKSGCMKIWQACLEANGIGEPPDCANIAIPEGFFRIGEEVDARGTGNLWYSGKVGVLLEKGGFYSSNIEVRLKPAWKPKDGEAVLTRVMDRAEVGYVSKGFLYVRGNRMPIEQVEDFVPFDDDKIGKPWSKI
jgi:hypothetical protein